MLARAGNADPLWIIPSVGWMVFVGVLRQQAAAKEGASKLAHSKGAFGAVPMFLHLSGIAAVLIYVAVNAYSLKGYPDGF